ncbi:helix-turn-helix domain-containing protein [Nocardia sp. NBC_01503]|uniref:helix-turn-helix domain-containing protein n=1 Tax=Nocardia sp. NBC_01503 TaxID=2975997 RepID=UPI002E7BAEE8|nr:helix-turn-helix transcriptional regulator [Nocardia sp. NBC_01503]WTL35297.1 helix-turn-helix domain-containing protein [Nocardia sp. NBC_01503]
MSTVSRRAFGKFLREIRDGAKVSALSAGLHIETSKQTLLRLEEGIPTKIATAQIGQLLDLYRVTPEVHAEALRLWGEVREQAKQDKLQGNSKGFWQPYTDQLASHFPHFLRLEAASNRATAHQLVLVPGLLQTADYRRALARLEVPGLSAVNVERRIELAEKRQVRLTEGEFAMDALLSEAVLRHQPASPAVMAAQMRWLAEVGNRDNISIRVVPFGAGPHRGLTIQSFHMLEFPCLESGLNEPTVVYLEGAVGALYHEQPEVVARYQEAISVLRAVALSEDDTRDMVLRVAKEYEA